MSSLYRVIEAGRSAVSVSLLLHTAHDFSGDIRTIPNGFTDSTGIQAISCCITLASVSTARLSNDLMSSSRAAAVSVSMQLR